MKNRILMRAALRRQRGSVLGIAILLFLSSLCLFTALTLTQSGADAVNSEMERLGYGDFTAWVSGDGQSLREQIEALPDTDHVTVQPLVYAGYQLGGKYSDNEGQLIVYDGAVPYRFVDDRGASLEVSEVKPGEIYLSPAMRSSFSVQVGDPIVFELSRSAEPYMFTVAGWFEDAFMGSSMIDMKSFLIAAADDAAIRNLLADAKDYDMLGIEGAMLHVFQASESELAPEQYSRQVQLSTDLSTHTVYTYSKASIHSYMLLLQNILSGFLLAFALVLLGICLIAVSHSLSAVIEQEQRSMAILKTLGMDGSGIRRVYLTLYGGTLLGALVLGFLPVWPLSRGIARRMLNSTGLLIPIRLSVPMMLCVLAGLLLCFVLFLLLRTRLILRIKPMQIIREERRGKGAKTPLHRRCLAFWMALREVTSAKKRYLALCLIAALLTLFLGIVGRMGSWLGPNGEGLMNAFSVADHDLGVQPMGATVPMDEIERAIHWYSPWTAKYALAMQPVTVNGQAYTANVLDNTQWFHVLRGENCQFNSILITDTVSHELGVSIGDTVRVAKGGRSADFLVSGIYQCANGMGSNIGMSVGGFARVAETGGYIWCYHYILENGAVRDYAMAFLQENYRGIDVHTNSWSGLDGIVALMHGLIGLIYLIAAASVLVTVLMTSGKLLQAEEGTMAVYRSEGMSAGTLRLAFSTRFLLVVALGAALGFAMAALVGDALISRVFSLFGIGRFSSAFSFLGLVLPPLAVILMFALFAWLSSTRISRVSMIQLISENEE